MVIIGYSGHGFVAASIIQAMGKTLSGYCDQVEKDLNPFALKFLGKETDAQAEIAMKANGFFIALGDNSIRRKIYDRLKSKQLFPENIIHPSACVTISIEANQGIMIAPQVVIHPATRIGKAVICNTGSIIEHDCALGDFVHIAPGAILCGNVTVGDNSFIGAGSVVRPGIRIGDNVLIGAGSVVVKDIPDGSRVMGNPAR